jgi:hypothetical protein
MVSDAIAKLEQAKSDWATAKAGPLTELNTALVRAGEKPIAVSAADLRDVDSPDPGEDLP